MIRLNFAATVGVLLAVALLLGGCDSNETATPEKTFNLLLTHVRNREFEKVWELYSQSLREKNLREYAEFKARMQGLIDSNDPNIDEYDNILAPQLGIGIRELVNIPEYDLVIRTLRMQREVILQFRIIAPAKVRGNLGLLEVAGGDEVPSSTWRFVKRGPGWLLEDTPFKANPRSPSKPR